MQFFKRNPDALDRHEQELRRQLERVQAELRRASTQPLREAVATRPPPRATRPEFPPAPTPPAQRPRAVRTKLVNEQGVRKFDLPGYLRRLASVFSGAEAYNRHMVRMLAAGSIDGLPVLRREKKRALYRFLLLFALFLLVLWGLAFTYLRDR